MQEIIEQLEQKRAQARLFEKYGLPDEPPKP